MTDELIEDCRNCKQNVYQAQEDLDNYRKNNPIEKVSDK